MNAIKKAMWDEVAEVFNKLDRDQEWRVVILSAARKMFSSGIDLSDLEDVAKWNMTMLQSEDLLQSAMAAMDKTNTEPSEFADF